MSAGKTAADWLKRVAVATAILAAIGLLADLDLAASVITGTAGA